MTGRKGIGLFNRIAPFYGKFYDFQKRRYTRIFEEQKSMWDISRYGTALDVGCGTGAMCAALDDLGLEVTGLDGAEKMLRIAERNSEDRDIRWIHGNILQSLPFPGKAFDVSVASYVAHGMQAKERRILYDEMARVTKEAVLIFDYNKIGNVFITLAERMEGSDYFRFIETAEAEMRMCFSQVRVVNVDTRAAWYLCIPGKG